MREITSGLAHFLDTMPALGLSNPIEQLLSAEPGTRVVRVDEGTLTIEPEFSRAPLCRCDLCGDGIVVRGDPEEGWWVQSATIAILTECEVPICDILGDDQPRPRACCDACLSDAQARLRADQGALLLKALREAETLAREIELTDANRQEMARTRIALAELVDMHAPSVGGAACAAIEEEGVA